MAPRRQAAWWPKMSRGGAMSGSEQGSTLASSVVAGVRRLFRPPLPGSSTDLIRRPSAAAGRRRDLACGQFGGDEFQAAQQRLSGSRRGIQWSVGRRSATSRNSRTTPRMAPPAAAAMSKASKHPLALQRDVEHACAGGGWRGLGKVQPDEKLAGLQALDGDGRKPRSPGGHNPRPALAAFDRAANAGRSTRPTPVRP